MRACFSILFLAAFATALQAAEPNERPQDKEKLQGTWTAVSVTDDGREAPKDQVKKLKLTIKGHHYIYEIAGRGFAADFKLAPAKEPKEIDITFTEGPAKGKTMRAIYLLEGDHLKVCGGDKRPAEFDSKPNSETVLFNFRREKQ